MIRWLLGHGDDLGHVPHWSPLRADQAAADTERLLLGHAGPVRVVGNRTVERREAQVQARRLREATQRAVVLAWRGEAR